MFVIIIPAFNCIFKSPVGGGCTILLLYCNGYTVILSLAWKHHYLPEGFCWHLTWKCSLGDGVGGVGENKDVKGRHWCGGVGNGCCRMWIFMETHAKCHMWTAWQTKKLMSGGDTQLLGNFLIISKAPVIWGGAGYLGWHTAGVNQL